MTKLPKNKKFLDVSDYARPVALLLVKSLLPTKIGAQSLSFAFLIIGLISAYLVYIESYLYLAAILLLVKSMLDAADGEIARQRNRPSMVGRYMDSIFDFIVNLFLFLSISFVFNFQIWLMLIALLLFQLQGSVFNYYYLVKRYQVDGDKTSRIFERETPQPYKGDNLTLLKIFHKIYLIIYGWQDYLIYIMDKNAINEGELPSWYLTLVSFLGLGFQLLIIAVFITLNYHEYILLFFIFPYSIFAILVILIRKALLK